MTGAYDDFSGATQPTQQRNRPGSEIKPYFQTENATIYHGDNVATMQAVIPDASIDLVVTSPPYDNLRTYGGHSWDFEGLAAELWRAIKPGGVVVWIVNDATEAAEFVRNSGHKGRSRLLPHEGGKTQRVLHGDGRWLLDSS